MYAEQHRGAIWIHLVLTEPRAHDPLLSKPTPASTIYLILLPSIDFILYTSTARTEILACVQQALMVALSCAGLKEWSLSGVNPEALVGLVMDGMSQGAWQKYRLGEVDRNPLAAAETPLGRRLLFL